MSETRLIQTISGLRASLAQARATTGARVALVPTMGNLHEGHLSLVEEAKQQAGFVVASIFVNPLQFVPGDDYQEYPRTLDADFERLAELGVDIAYAPSVEQMYPQGQSATRVLVKEISQELCGAYRPGHFTGVTTVVNMLLNQVQPQVAVFGQKDYQQLVLIRRMVSDLHLPVEIVGVRTVRADDGLALSSRNQYLSAAERGKAVQLYASLQAAGARLRAGERDFAQIEEQAVAHLRANGFEPDYFAVRTPQLHLPDGDTQEYMLLVAAHLGRARLIDNLRIEVDLR